jgi:hypothetical protein
MRSLLWRQLLPVDVRLLVGMQSRDTPFPPQQRRQVGWIILAAYLLFLAYGVACEATKGKAANSCAPNLLLPHGLIHRIDTLLLAALRRFTYFLPVGIGATLLAPVDSGKLQRFALPLPALAVGSALTILACATPIVTSWCSTAVVGLVFSLLGCCLGVWIASAGRRGWRACLLLLSKIALLILLTLLALGITLWLSLEEMPFPWEAAPASSAEKQRVMCLIRSESPRFLKEDQTYTLRLTEQDVNVLLSAGVADSSGKPRTAVCLRPDSFALLISLPVQCRAGRPRYLNWETTGSVGIQDAALRLRVDHCRIGRLGLPRWLSYSLGRVVASYLNHDRYLKPFLMATREIILEPNSIQLTYRPLDVPLRLRQRLLRPAVAGEDLLIATRAQVDHLLLFFATCPLSDRTPSFNLCLKTAFSVARDRSTRSDPVTENRAAILALGILLGHPGIADFLGPVVREADPKEMQQILTRVPLYGRSDWTRHFCVSAAIAALADETVSDACALLKEKWDTDSSGSGFSFADLLMDRAGTALAGWATRDATTARSLQDRLVRGFRLEEVCPPPGDLPEGISKTDLESRYGGIGGEGYRGLLGEIEQRVAACTAYQ